MYFLFVCFCVLTDTQWERHSSNHLKTELWALSNKNTKLTAQSGPNSGKHPQSSSFIVNILAVKEVKERPLFGRKINPYTHILWMSRGESRGESPLVMWQHQPFSHCGGAQTKTLLHHLLPLWFFQSADSWMISPLTSQLTSPWTPSPPL